jgi:hypothetical protein
MSTAPCEKRRGRLLNGNPSGDFSKAPRCGAKTRSGGACLAPAMRDKRRCRLHGGHSTGPRTAEGAERAAKANLRHGRYTKEWKAEQQQARQLRRETREMIAWLERKWGVD